jgi:hypothetical protein
VIAGPRSGTEERRFAALELVVLLTVVLVVATVLPTPGVGARGSASAAAVPILPTGAPRPVPATVGVRWAAGLEPVHASAGPGLFGTSSPLSAPPSRAGISPLVSDPVNPELANFSSTTSVTSVGPGNQSVVVGADDLAAFEDGSGAFWSEGISAAFRTNDGGATWSSNFLGRNASWTTSGNPEYGDLAFGQPSVSGGPNGTVLYATQFAQPCNEIQGATCNSTLNNSAPSGIAVGRSLNSAVSWQSPTPVFTAPWYRWTGIVPCAGDNWYDPVTPANYSDKPSVAYSSATGEAIVAWELLSFSDKLACIDGQIGIEIFGETLSVEVSVSLDNGVVWSAPKTIGRINTGAPSVAIGPAPSYTLSVVYDDDYNGTATSHSIAFSQSTDRGAAWSAPVDIGPYTLTFLNNGTAPDVFTVPTLPSYAVDNWTGSPFRGNEYVVVGSNLSANVPGSPSVVFVRSAAGSGSWSGATVVARANATTEYFEPTVSVGPSGRVWLVFYAMTVATGDYRLFGEYSDDGGGVWTAPFPIADTPSAPGNVVTSIGAWVGAAATSAGLYSAWTDCRWAGCAANQETAVDAALTAPVTITSGLPSVAVTSSSLGSVAAGPVPVETAWDEDAAVTVAAPAWASLANSTEWVGVFSNYSGLLSSSNSLVSFDYDGGSALSANYATGPAAWVAGTVYPASANPKVTVDGMPVSLSAYNASAVAFNVSVEAGVSVALAVTATDYDPVSELLLTTAHVAGPGPIVLIPSDGWIRGRLTSTFPATVTVNGTTVPGIDPTTGVFNVSERWGLYWVNATGPGLDSTGQYIAVLPGRSTEVNLTVVGAWVDGTVAPGNATVRLDGALVPLTNGAFNVSVLAGSHTLTASLPGYSLFRETFVAYAARVTFVAVSITDYGTIRGTVDPASAAVLVDGNVEPVVSGSFDLDVRAGATYNVTVASAGYGDGYANLVVTPANTSYANFTLTALPGCTSGCGGHSGGSSGSTGASGNPYSWLDVGIAAAVILGAALVGAFLVRRPPRGPEVSSAPAEEPAPPDEAQAIYGVPGSDDPGVSEPPPG